MNSIVLYLTPLIGVNQFTFKTDINRYTNFDFRYTSLDSDDIGYETYDVDDFGLTLYVENRIIVSMSCTYELLYKGRNIIGMDINEFINYYEVNYSGTIDKIFVNDEESQNVYEFDTLGLQIWCRYNQIVTVIASY